MQKRTKLQNDQTGQNPVSAIVESVRSNNAEKALVSKGRGAKRERYLKSLEADAQAFIKGFQTAKAISAEASVLHRKFKDVVEEMRPLFERVRFGFAHLRKGETVMGERTGTAWAERYVGLSYDWLCRCLSPPKAGTLLLVEGTKVVAPSAVNNDSSREEGQIPLPQLTKKNFQPFRQPTPRTGPTTHTSRLAWTLLSPRSDRSNPTRSDFIEFLWR